jgi:Uncharacterized alpha/beta hydrolase domain (DUF2235)
MKQSFPILWAGDEIYIFGFSRGAYAARVLAGLIGASGIQRQNNRRYSPPNLLTNYDRTKSRKIPKRNERCSGLMRCINLSPTRPLKVQHNAPKAGPNVFLMKTKLGGHLQHARIFSQDIPIDPAQAFLFGIIDDVLHQ